MGRWPAHGPLVVAPAEVDSAAAISVRGWCGPQTNCTGFGDSWSGVTLIAAAVALAVPAAAVGAAAATASAVSLSAPYLNRSAQCLDGSCHYGKTNEIEDVQEGTFRFYLASAGRLVPGAGAALRCVSSSVLGGNGFVRISRLCLAVVKLHCCMQQMQRPGEADVHVCLCIWEEVCLLS